jgi:hypothetical protein
MTLKTWKPDQIDTDDALTLFALAVAVQAIGIIATVITGFIVLVVVLCRSVWHHNRKKGN